MRSKSSIYGLLAACVLIVSASCSRNTYKKINYLQDIDTQTTVSVKENQGILVQPKDQISVVVSHRNPELAIMFNLPVANIMAGSESSQGQQRLQGYNVDSNGEIDFPVLGKIHVAGRNRWQVAELIKDEIQSRNLLKDPIVTVDFMNFKISVLGDVAHPGTFNIVGDKVTILEAIGMAGDLNITGRRDNIRVIRQANGKRTVYVLDIRNSDIFSSPAFYLCQNDVVIVTPNEVRAGQSTINENNLKSTSFWVSIGSLLLSMASIIINLAK
ncbi:MAG: polysaccharide biosynthesis/export family protein [Bacteroidales bacterium]|nr:polysaccharide biosynthesis/export family protein [Bacteroidales bacterium]